MLDALALARVATCNKALQVLFSDGVVGSCMTHCREASERANLMEATLNRVVQERDAALDRAQVADERRLEDSRRHEVDLANLDEMRGYYVQACNRVLELKRELAEAKLAR